MKLIIGLGNIGDRYINTRHNIGFLFVDYIKQYLKIENDFIFNKKLECFIIKSIWGNQPIHLIQPTTFMNNSGRCVLKVKQYYKYKNRDIIVVHDDIDTDFGKIKFKYNSSSGGHNGIRSILQYLKTQNLMRLKFGIKDINKKDTSDFVLSKFNKSEYKKIYDNIFPAIIKSFEKKIIIDQDYSNLTISDSSISPI